ncbi:hypothetical protein KDA_20580 [Dictyobacter alpinus]|uniref:non-specific serine/threonine protein kinase n=1 Tax=Dictyobacter alpinus TaxID=2014873 RepID=A0A402B5F0_9CHLR|nr:serine/threonine-protein kinase [Dictyobacter alpinus]GCE26574.1 hypothetical protein KDA_20580 [Dictyobacter alpinus]
MEDRIGQQLGNYKLLRLIGQGGFADVYLGEHIHLRTQAAIKILQVRLGESNIQNFLNEARTIAHLVHPSIIRVLDFGVQDNTPFLVMDYAPRGTFRQRFLQGKPMPAAQLVPYIKQTAAALQYGHDKKLIHRDVKPENMLLSNNDEVLLGDFGLALIAYSTISHSPTETAGTAAYMAPEQLQGKPRPASDQYALGVIAYEWLTGKCPFEGSFFEVASQQVLSPAPQIREKAPQVSKEVEAVVMRALEKDPQKRFPNVRDFAQALEEACGLGQQRPSDTVTNEKGTSTSINTKTLQERFDTARSQSQRLTPSAIAAEKTPRPITHRFPEEERSAYQSVKQEPLKPQATPPVPTSASRSARTIPIGSTSMNNMPPFPPLNPSTPVEASGNLRSDIRIITPEPDSKDDMPIYPNKTPTDTPDMPTRPNASQADMPSMPTSTSMPRGARPLPLGSYMTPAGNRPAVSKAMHPTDDERNGSDPNHTSFTGKSFQPASGQLVGSTISRFRPSAFSDSIKTPAAPFQRATKSYLNTRNLIIVAVVLLLIIGSAITISMVSMNNASNASQQAALDQKNATATSIVSHANTTAKATQVVKATQTAQVKLETSNSYLPDGASTLVLNDALTSNRNGWQEGVDPTGITGGQCTFTPQGYQVRAPALAPMSCFQNNHPHSDFTYQVNVSFTNIGQSFSGAGIVFRGTGATGQYYFFEIFDSGNYSLQKCYNWVCTNYMDGYKNAKPPLTSFKHGLNVNNTLAVTMQGTTIALYLNKEKVSEVTDTINAPFETGDVGVMATGGNDTGVDSPNNTITTAIFSQAKIWDIKK